MKLRFRAIGLTAALAVVMPAPHALASEPSVTLVGSVSNLDIVRVFLISQADNGFDGLAGKHASVDAGSLAELHARSRILNDLVISNGKELDRRLCIEGGALLNSKESFDALYVEAFRQLDRANNEATAQALDDLPAAAYKFLVDELASISFVRSGSRVLSGPKNRERAVQLSCGRLSG